MSQRLYGLAQTLKPAQSGFSGPLRQQPRENAVEVAFALALVLTRKAMLYAQFLKRLFGGLSAPGLHVLIALADAFYGFLKILLFPCQIFGQGFIERGGGVLAAALRVGFELGLAFRCDGYDVHSSA
jgi:hypothetical protein